MKQFLIISLLLLQVAFAQSQTNWTYSDNFSAKCKSTIKSAAVVADIISIQNDSVFITDSFEDQCCPEFALKISDIQNDSVYVSFQDTTKLLCDCVCTFDIKLNIGKYIFDKLAINYNGTWYDIQSTGVNKLSADAINLVPNPVSDYLILQPSVQQIRYVITDLSGKQLSTGFSDGTIDVRQLDSGNYIVRLFDLNGKSLLTKKILKK